MRVYSEDDLGAVEIEDDNPVFEAIRSLVVLEDVQEIVENRDGVLLTGDQHIVGHLHIYGQLVVDGALKVDGAISIDDGASLLVRSHVTCKNFFTGGGDFVTPDLTVEHATYGSYESGYTYATVARGKVWIQGAHAFEFEDDTFESVIDVEGTPKEDTSEEVKVLSAKGLELAFVIPLKAYNGDDEAEVSDDDWMEALRADEVLL